MSPRQLHAWDVTPEEAMEIQRRLAPQVSRDNRVPAEVRFIAGVDLSLPGKGGDTGLGAVVILTYPALEVVEVQAARKAITWPYIPGLLSFRETPVLLDAFDRLVHIPDMVIVDGQGIAHPRRLGIACHLGLLLDIPAIGCAKSILRGRYAGLGQQAGDWAELIDQGEVVGAAVRTRTGVQPVYVSLGHKIDLAGSIRWVLACARRYRLPEPTRLAHEAAAGRLPVGVRPPQKPMAL